MRTILTILFVLSGAVLNANFEALTEFQKNIIQEEETGSNVAMVFKDEQVVYFHAQNSSKPGDKDVTQHSIFPIWSMSKPITIVAMMTLYEKGLLDFEDPVSKYIPQFADVPCLGPDGVYDCVNELKIIHLMTHRSGYSYRGVPDHTGTTSTIKYNNLKDFVEDVAKVPLAFEPGKKYLYGLNQAILGRVVEVITGETFYEYLKKTIFDPLEMKSTKFYLTADERANRFQPLFINTGTLKGFTFELNELSYAEDNHAYYGGEGLVSTITDYSKFCQMLLNGGSLEGKKIITPKSIEIMTKKRSEGYPFEEYAGTNKLGFYYGFSLFVLENPAIDGVGASKGIYGWSGYHNTHFWIDPEKNMFGLFMSRARGVSPGFQKRLREAVYSSLE
ncbi:MAG: serine hydrolase [Verrucomicrobia bacterium]|nr:serine hydrolase [Verrucomicrobiota bacterium]MDA1067067.1 serine hydrolase [Verrucomicrobiota bacterium]